MADLSLLLLDMLAQLIEWLLRLFFRLARQYGIIRHAAPEATRPQQTLLPAAVLLFAFTGIAFLRDGDFQTASVRPDTGKIHKPPDIYGKMRASA